MLRIQRERLIAAGDGAVVLPEVRENVSLPLPGCRVFGIEGECPVKAGERLIATAGFDESKPFPPPENRVVRGEFKGFIVTRDRFIVVSGVAKSLASVVPSFSTLFSCRHRTYRGTNP
jgi:hypothetical protein